MEILGRRRIVVKQDKIQSTGKRNNNPLQILIPKPELERIIKIIGTTKLMKISTAKKTRKRKS